MKQILVSRYHDFSYGHRVCGHESVCSKFHGHNGRVHFFCSANSLDEIGRVIDFSAIKKLLCMWLEDNWDHRFLLYEEDFLLKNCEEACIPGIVSVSFNPTAENMAKYLLEVVGPDVLKGTNVSLVKVIVEETRKCSAQVSIIGEDDEK